METSKKKCLFKILIKFRIEHIFSFYKIADRSLRVLYQHCLLLSLLPFVDLDSLWVFNDLKRIPNFLIIHIVNFFSCFIESEKHMPLQSNDFPFCFLILLNLFQLDALFWNVWVIWNPWRQSHSSGWGFESLCPYFILNVIIFNLFLYGQFD